MSSAVTARICAGTSARRRVVQASSRRNRRGGPPPTATEGYRKSVSVAVLAPPSSAPSGGAAAIRNVSRRISLTAAGAFSGDKVPPMDSRPGSLGVVRGAVHRVDQPFPVLDAR